MAHPSSLKVVSLLVLLGLLAAACAQVTPLPPPPTGPKIDDWQTAPDNMGESTSQNRAGANAATGGIRSGPAPAFDAAGAPSAMGMSAGKSGGVGLSVGGAKDIQSFRENIRNGYLPLPTDITYEGLFYDYYFDTGTEKCDELFCPSASAAISKDPLSDKPEYFLAVGLDSGLETLERPPLNLVLVLDISGSMNSPLDEYYYDRSGRRTPMPQPLASTGTKALVDATETDEEPVSSPRTKIELAAGALSAILDHLTPTDRVGIVIFNDDAQTVKPLRLVGETKLDETKKHIDALFAQGGTRLSAGMEEATTLFDALDADEDVRADGAQTYSNRIIFLTDAQPNLGQTDDARLLDMIAENAENGVSTTFVGIGLDFNSELAEGITKARGANYLTLSSRKEFSARLDEGFDYLVTPLAFNLRMRLDAPGFKIVRVFGAPDTKAASADILSTNTLFASPKQDDAVRGGLILVQLAKTGDEPEMHVKLEYEDGQGVEHSTSKVLAFSDDSPDWYGNDGIRKGILLSRYANLLQDWLIDERAIADPIVYEDGWEYETPLADSKIGIMPPPFDIPPSVLGRWERTSLPLSVSAHYRGLFSDFESYFQSEADALKDPALDQELAVLSQLARDARSASEG